MFLSLETHKIYYQIINNMIFARINFQKFNYKVIHNVDNTAFSRTNIY